jgi:hypothetical protein
MYFEPWDIYSLKFSCFIVEVSLYLIAYIWTVLYDSDSWSVVCMRKYLCLLLKVYRKRRRRKHRSSLNT